MAETLRTALVAKQTADLQRLSGERLILGVGIGNNPTEFKAMGIPYKNLGDRLEKQIDIIRRLWKGEIITNSIGREIFNRCTLNPNCSNNKFKPPPIWIGGFAEAVLERTAKIGDGYLPMCGPDDQRLNLDFLRNYLSKYKRDVATFPILGAFPKGKSFQKLGWDEIKIIIKKWKNLGVTHLAFGTQGNGYENNLKEHIKLARQFINLFNDIV